MISTNSNYFVFIQLSLIHDLRQDTDHFVDLLPAVALLCCLEYAVIHVLLEDQQIGPLQHGRRREDLVGNINEGECWLNTGPSSLCPACKSEPPPRRSAATYACVQGGLRPPKNGTGQNYWLESSDSGICITSPVNLFTNSPLILVKSSSSPLVLSKWNGASLSVRAGPMI